MRKKDNHEQLACLVENMPKPPKYTKEQKVVLKALKYLSAAKYRAEIKNNKTRLIDGNFEYAMGLLESLLMQDDKEE